MIEGLRSSECCLNFNSGMETTPVRHRSRRGRLALPKCRSSPAESTTTSTVASTVKAISTNVSPPLSSTPTTLNSTPSFTGNNDRKIILQTTCGWVRIKVLCHRKSNYNTFLTFLYLRSKPKRQVDTLCFTERVHFRGR